MGYRAHVIKKYEIEYGDCLGYNYDHDGFIDLISNKLELDAFYPEGDACEAEIATDDLLNLKEEQIAALDPEEQETIRSLIKVAKTADYAKDGFVLVKWL